MPHAHTPLGQRARLSALLLVVPLQLRARGHRAARRAARAHEILRTRIGVSLQLRHPHPR
jgi:hypothetical protein